MKTTRQEKILQLIEEKDISTQEELTALLNNLGFKTTQATVSRDIKSLGLKKIPTETGQKYIYTDSMQSSKDKYLRIFADGMTGMDQAANLVVIKTISGMAMAVAAALDGLDLKELIGSIAGDDTIMCACRSDQDAEILINNIEQLLKEIK